MLNVNSNKNDWLNKCNELIKSEGFCLVSNVVSEENNRLGIDVLKDVYLKVTNLIGMKRLKRANEEGVIRAPMNFDSYFFSLLDNEKIQKLSEKLITTTSILHLQNGFIFPKHNSNTKLSNFQYTFHADYPRYMNGYIASMNMLVTFTDIKEEDEIFYVVPRTHHSNYQLSQEYCHQNKISISAKAGSILVFDSTLWHCGGANYSNESWFGVNHQFTRSFIKQQMDYVRLLGDRVVLQQTPRVQQMLGYYTRVVTSLDEYYLPTEKRLYRSNQG